MLTSGNTPKYCCQYLEQVTSNDNFYEQECKHIYNQIYQVIIVFLPLEGMSLRRLHEGIRRGGGDN